MLFYITCIRFILEYTCPVFHRALPGYLSEDLERLQKRALRIIHPGMSYNQALEFSGLPTLFKMRFIPIVVEGWLCAGVQRSVVCQGQSAAL